MPVFRYFLVMGCCLLGLLLAASWMWPGDAGSGAHPATVAAADPASTGLKSKDLKSQDLKAQDLKAQELKSQNLASQDLASQDLASTDLGTASTVLSSIDDWRRSERRFERSKHDPQPIVYPDTATLAPTPDRLQWERQLRYLPANHIYEARAEMPKGEMHKGAAAESPKVAEKTRPPRKHVAHTRSHARTAAANVERSRHPRYARNNAWDPFGLFD